MSLHDEYARVTPYEIAFPDDEAVDRLIRDVDEEASSRGVDAGLPGIFITLGAVGGFVRELRPPDASTEAKDQYGVLAFQAVHFAREGRPLYLLDTAATRYLIEGVPDADPQPPSPAGYLQLPQHLFWMDRLEEGAPESMDGLFWFASGAGVLHSLPITSVLTDQASFRALPLPQAPLRDATEWMHTHARDGEADFASSIPGHDLDRLYSVQTAGEVLKLLARFFAYVGAVPAAGRGGPPGGEPTAAQGPRPSRLPYTKVTLVT
jgi:hypothetical protein